jgi:hypothetical protein
MSEYRTIQRVLDLELTDDVLIEEVLDHGDDVLRLCVC